jgi:hypothetical protein
LKWRIKEGKKANYIIIALGAPNWSPEGLGMKTGAIDPTSGGGIIRTRGFGVSA